MCSLTSFSLGVVDGQNDSKYRDCAPSMAAKEDDLVSCGKTLK